MKRTLSSTTLIAGCAFGLALAACGTDPEGTPNKGGGSGAGAGTATPPPTGTTGTGSDQPPIDLNLGDLTKTACGGEPATVLFVVDKSGSMACNLPGVTPSLDCEANPVRAELAQPTKWQIVTEIMSANMGSMITGEDGIDVYAGLSFFSRDNRCGVLSAPNVPVTLMDDVQVASIQEALRTATPGGPTPIVGALMTAYRHLHQELQARGDRYVVLLTDGSDPCQADYEEMFPDGAGRNFIQELVDVHVPSALDANIKTYVIGAPGSENNLKVLSSIAVAGGTAPEGCDPDQTSCHYDMTQGDFEAQFQTAMAEITAAVACAPIQ